MHRRPSLSVVSALAAAAGLSTMVAMSAACGSIDCAETATCPEPAADATESTLDAATPVDEVEEGGNPQVGEGVFETGADGGIGTPGDSGPDVDAGVGDAARVGDAAGDGPDGCALTEDCTNGIDDNCDGKIDCADPQCMPSYMCTPAFPPGWSGPVAVFEQDSDGGAPTVPPCPSAYPTLAQDGHATPLAAGASCQCTCQGPCSLVVSTYTNNNCGGTHLCAATTVSASCVPAAGACAVQTAKITTGVAFAGCSPGAQKSVPPYSWVTAARACASGRTTYFQGGCDAGQVCAEAPPTTFARGLCIYQSGNPACPAGGYAVAHAVYGDAGDSRDCNASACQCSGGAAGGTCSATNVTLSSASNCAGGACLGGSCGAPFPLTSSPYIGATLTYSSGSCTSTGTASPVGTVTPNTPTTICCAN
jgi:hypothetical protein